MDDFEHARERMVTEQLARRGIRDPRVLEAMRRVPRHEFVPVADRSSAYDDRALPIGEAQTISQPYIVAAMTEALALTGTERVLEIGTGSGYQAAILCRLAREVVSIERFAILAEAARVKLASVGCTNVDVVVGDGSVGYGDRAPYHGILVTAAAPHVPESLLPQLADGGRLVIPVGSRAYQELVVVTRRGDTFEQSSRDGCVFVPLVGEQGWPSS